MKRLPDLTGLDRRALTVIEEGEDDTVELRVVRLVVNTLGMDVELRPRDSPFVPVPPSRVDELGLSTDTLAALDGAGIHEVADVPSGDVLLGYPEFASGAEAWEVACALNRHGMTIPAARSLPRWWESVRLFGGPSSGQKSAGTAKGTAHHSPSDAQSAHQSR